MLTRDNVTVEGSEETRALGAPTEQRKRAGQGRLATTSVAVFAVVMAILVAFPIGRLVVLSLQGGGENITAALQTPGIAGTLRNTLVLALLSLVIAIALGTLLAWLASRLPAKRQWASTLPILPIVLPPIAGISAWAFLLAPRAGLINQWIRELPMFAETDLRAGGPINVYSFGWVVVLTGLYLTSFMYVFLRAGLARIGNDVFEAARSNGASPAKAFFTIVLPMLRPSLVFGSATCLLLGLSQFTAPLLLGSKEDIRVLTTDVYFNMTVQRYGTAAALSMPLLALGIVLVLAQRGLLGNGKRFATDVGKGVQGNARPSRWAAPALMVYGGVVVVVPIIALVVVALSPVWTGEVNPGDFTLRNFELTLGSANAQRAIQTSLVSSLVGVLVAVPIGYLAAEVVYRRRGGRLLAGVVDFLVGLPIGVPAVVFGLGFLYVYSQPGIQLYGTFWILILLYLTLMLPYSVRLQLAARISMGDSYEAAARTCGAGRLRTHVLVLIPMMRGSIAGAAALMFVLLSHEFSASIFVRSVRRQVMGTQLYDYWSTGSATQVAVMGLTMCLITAIGVGLTARAGSGSLDKL